MNFLELLFNPPWQGGFAGFYYGALLGFINCEFRRVSSRILWENILINGLLYGFLEYMIPFLWLPMVINLAYAVDRRNNGGQVFGPLIMISQRQNMKKRPIDELKDELKDKLSERNSDDDSTPPMVISDHEEEDFVQVASKTEKVE